jgi:hypothetical protein
MIAYNSTIKYKDNTDLQQFIEGTYLPDKVKTLEELDNIDIKISELVENINDGKISRLTNNTVYNDLAVTGYDDLAVTGYDNTIGLRDEVEELEYYNTVEHKKLKKLAKLAILGKYI